MSSSKLRVPRQNVEHFRLLRLNRAREGSFNMREAHTWHETLHQVSAPRRRNLRQHIAARAFSYVKVRKDFLNFCLVLFLNAACQQHMHAKIHPRLA